ncbi:unnamed protein product, partial [Polarella glacialis]
MWKVMASNSWACRRSAQGALGSLGAGGARHGRRGLGGVSASLLQMATEIGDVTSGYALLTAVASSIVGGFSYWGFVGGPILTFTYLKPLLFGRNFHTLEYPHGSLRTITVRFVNQN